MSLSAVFVPNTIRSSIFAFLHRGFFEAYRVSSEVKGTLIVLKDRFLRCGFENWKLKSDVYTKFYIL